MPTCPRCQTEGADILLNSVFCPNPSCHHFDQVTKDRIEKLAKGLVSGIIKRLNKSDKVELTEPDDTPIWYPTFDLNTDDTKD